MYLALYIYTYRYTNITVTTNQKSKIDTQKRERNPDITSKILIKSQWKRAKEGNKKDHKNNPKTTHKMIKIR